MVWITELASELLNRPCWEGRANGIFQFVHTTRAVLEIGKQVTKPPRGRKSQEKVSLKYLVSFRSVDCTAIGDIFRH